MISIIRMKCQSEKKGICDYIISHRQELQKSIKNKGQLLYLSKRVKHDDISLFVHTMEPDVLGNFVANYLSKIEDVTGIWVINLFKPIFYPLPRDTKDFQRFSIILRVYTGKLKEVYQNLAVSVLPEGLKKAYLAYTFHLFGDSIQFSVLVDKASTIENYVAKSVDLLPGVLKSTVVPIERTKPLVSYEEWRKYSSEHGIIPSWDEELMIKQFQEFAV